MFTCPECEGEINPASELCPRCGADLAALAAAAAAVESAKERSLPELVFIWGAVIVVIAASLYAFVWHVLPEYSGTASARSAEARAVESLRAVQSAIGAYAAAQNGCYPGSPESLGDRARAAMMSAREAGYSLDYTPGPAESGGGARTYALTARALRFGLRNYFTDQTGVLRATRENRSATAQDPAL